MHHLFIKFFVITLYLCPLMVSFNPASISAQPVKAPSWQGVEWINLEPGNDSLDVTDLEGRVIYLSFFQKW